MTASLILLSLAGLVKSVDAQEVTTISPEYPSLYKGVRPEGMGNAFIAMPGSDENAPFYNPAAINDYEKRPHFRILSPSLDFSPGSIGLVKDVIDLAKDVNAALGNEAKVNVFRTFVDNHIGQFQSVAVRMPVIQVQQKWFFVSLLGDTRNTISFRNRAFTNIEISSRSDVGGVVGSAYNFKDLFGIEQNIQLGVDVKVIHRVSIDRIVATNDIINNSRFSDSVPIKHSTGVGVDLGLKGDFPTLGVTWLEAIKPTLAVTYQDIGNTRFAAGIADTQQSVSAGFAVHPRLGSWEFHVANDFRELNQDSAFMKKWHIGAEAFAPKLGFFRPSFRIGGNQGYIGGGTTLDFKYAKLEFATYGEEAGVATSNKQLRRLAVNLSFGF